MSNRKSGPNTGRNKDGTFGLGNPGKPKGARHKATMAAQELLDGEIEALTRKAIELAKAGDMAALRLCMERIVPPRRDAPISIEDPGPIENPDDVVHVLSAVMAAVIRGELTLSEAAAFSGLAETFRRTLETQELERRISELEREK